MNDSDTQVGETNPRIVEILFKLEKPEDLDPLNPPYKYERLCRIVDGTLSNHSKLKFLKNHYSDNALYVTIEVNSESDYAEFKKSIDNNSWLNRPVQVLN